MFSNFHFFFFYLSLSFFLFFFLLSSFLFPFLLSLFLFFLFPFLLPWLHCPMPAPCWLHKTASPHGCHHPSVEAETCRPNAAAVVLCHCLILHIKRDPPSLLVASLSECEVRRWVAMAAWQMACGGRGEARRLAVAHSAMGRVRVRQHSTA
jgi:hypothetical protein